MKSCQNHFKHQHKNESQDAYKICRLMEQFLQLFGDDDIIEDWGWQSAGCFRTNAKFCLEHMKRPLVLCLLTEGWSVKNEFSVSGILWESIWRRGAGTTQKCSAANVFWANSSIYCGIVAQKALICINFWLSLIDRYKSTSRGLCSLTVALFNPILNILITKSSMFHVMQMPFFIVCIS